LQQKKQPLHGAVFFADSFILSAALTEFYTHAFDDQPLNTDTEIQRLCNRHKDFLY
jgi:transcriptional regulator of met regulon